MKNKLSMDEFKELYISEIPMYKAWGEYVKTYILEGLIDLEIDKDKIIKIPVEPRIKAIDSIIEKAFIRKSYEDPYNMITDKVGIRFVVLLESQIKIIKALIEDNENWDYSEDVDYIKNKTETPELFTYQSVHYIVRNRNELTFNEYNITQGTPCEIQVRTLEQHAYAEISHDMIYKKNANINSEVKRFLARSMALNEATDDLFERVYTLMEKEKIKYYKFTNAFKTYIDFNNMSEKINKSLYDMVEEIVNNHNISVEQVQNFIVSKPFITENITLKSSRYIIYQQPIIYLIYYLAKSHSSELIESWDLTEDLLAPVFSDLGISYGEY
ncbi:hypothetical protein [Clostridium sp. KNHs205]|uniref:GTP pyrophosphokinase n=1 Tax=Clostridium sp. KNHs205 TaxID=1449050 RepID=UPI00068CA3C2|nr:hypothetical protein [Clostridium sp. KNHs205]